MGERRDAYGVLVGKPEEKRSLGTRRLKCKNNIRMDLILYGTDLAKERDKLRAFVNTVMSLRFT
jgi:hypothetical protein